MQTDLAKKEELRVLLLVGTREGTERVGVA